MNELLRGLMDKPSVIGSECAFCGAPRSEYHHIVKRSAGGTTGPVIAVCGHGNTGGCHGLLETHRLHMRWRDGWEYLYTPEPTKYQAALEMEGWRRL